jgi:Bacterial membrane protein YfhO
VRFHLWVSLGVAALAACGVERLGRPGTVSLKSGLVLAGVLVAVSIPIMIYIYAVVWTQPKEWTEAYHLARYRWLGRELMLGIARTVFLAVTAWFVAWRAARATDRSRRAHRAAILPVLVLADLLSAHWVDVPTVDPSYWTVPPASALRLKDSPGFIRVFGIGDKASGEPGYASETVDFPAVRDPLDWSLPLVWHLSAARGNTPMISRRLADFTNEALGKKLGRMRFDLEGDSHIVTGRRRAGDFPGLPRTRVGAAYIHRNRNALPRARLMGQPVYAADQPEAVAALERLGLGLRDQLVVEDPVRPLAADAAVRGIARIVLDLPERVVIEAQAVTPAYLVLADTFDPGWSATVDDRSAPIRPAYVAFRAVYLTPGMHKIVFTYRPAGLDLGLSLTGCGLLLGLVLWFWHSSSLILAPEHSVLYWPPRWRTWWFLALAAIVLVSAVAVGPSGRLRLHSRWKNSLHRHTWGSGLEAMRGNRM